MENFNSTIKKEKLTPNRNSLLLGPKSVTNVKRPLNNGNLESKNNRLNASFIVSDASMDDKNTNNTFVLPNQFSTITKVNFDVNLKFDSIFKNLKYLFF